MIVSIRMHLSYFTGVRHTLPQSRRSKRHSNSSVQARVNNTRLCLWSGSLLHKACSFKDLRLTDRRFQLCTSPDHDSSTCCSHLHHLGPFREERTKRKMEVIETVKGLKPFLSLGFFFHSCRMFMNHFSHS